MAGSGDKNIFDELKAMKERMEDLFTSSFELGTGGQDRPQKTADWVPIGDIIDSGKEFVYLLDLPGVMEHDIQVECKADRLFVSGLKKNDLPDGETLRVERPSGVFSRVFRFSCPVDENGIQAELKKGVLRINVPKSFPECSTRKIEVCNIE